MKPVNRLAGLTPPPPEILMESPLETESNLDKANALCAPDLREFALNLDARERLLLADRLKLYIKQLRASAKVLQTIKNASA